ncbi:CmlA/FloR family chloramphenicol efflux MFS transporter [Devosia sp. SL43]|uniref:CmlA/FloR family chloramphenicol efflux MFS transporter n=1 Tax=Devosia sp. SL43 TaxID=2806348 RepID=UPI001F159BE0|nr:CmlA/FloR family chloramphenicol efflux MFS transporter [Devosia sp. SL43]UJW84645.1 CmlA/FloR family chloramphenicol efflux MFS transporter [Devosia sp. SL43]
MPKPNPVWAYSIPAALLLMAPFDILASLAMDIYLPIVPSMPAMLGTSPDLVQLTLTVYMITLGVGQIVFGPLSDRIGRRSVLLGGAALYAAASFALAMISAPFPFLLCRFLQAAGAAAVLVSTFATVRDVYADRPEGSVIYSLLGAMLSFVPALGPIAGALIADNLGWRTIFVVLGGLAVVAGFNAGWRWPETRPEGTERRLSWTPMLRSPAFWTYTLGFSAAMGTFFVFFSTAPRILIDGAGFSELGFSLAFSTAALAMIITTRFARSFVARWGIPGSLRRGMLTLLVGAVLAALGDRFDVPPFVGFIMPMWVMAIGIVFASAVTANGALAAFADRAGTAVALYFCVQSLFVGIVGTAMVVLLPGDTAWPLVAYAAGMAIVVLLALSLLDRR